jgi:hypothetical protein
LRATRQLFSQILQWRKIEGMPMRLEPDNEHVMLRHDISNNGLFDVWELWNDSKTDTVKSELVLEPTPYPAWRIDLRDGMRAMNSHGRFDIALAPCQTAIYLTPRGAITEAPAEWFKLQRNWWQGSADLGKPFPAPSPNLAVNLTPDWAFKPLDPTADVAPLTDPQLNDSDWPRMELGIFSISDYPGAKHGIFRKKFTVPSEWNKGRVNLSMQYCNGDEFRDSGHVFLDGKPLAGLVDNACGNALQPGSSHLLAVEITGGNTELNGAAGPAWLAYHPEPAARLDLSGPWDISSDRLHYAPAQLPGVIKGTSARRVFKIDASESSRNVIVHALGEGRSVGGMIINGRYVSPYGNFMSSEENLNITPWVKFGQDNELILFYHLPNRNREGNLPRIPQQGHVSLTHGPLYSSGS